MENKNKKHNKNENQKEPPSRGCLSRLFPFCIRPGAPWAAADERVYRVSHEPGLSRVLGPLRAALTCGVASPTETTTSSRIPPRACAFVCDWRLVRDWSESRHTGDGDYVGTAHGGVRERSDAYTSLGTLCIGA